MEVSFISVIKRWYEKKRMIQKSEEDRCRAALSDPLEGL